MKIYEIGAGNPFVCKSINDNENECWLFEPNSSIYKELVETLKNKNNIKIFNCAIGDYDGKIKLYLDGNNSFIEGVTSPKVQNSSTQEISQLKTEEVECKTLSNFDNGDIDHLLLNMEGAEWFAIKHLKSRPKQITVKFQLMDKTYINPYYNEIVDWFAKNRYTLNIKQEIGEDWTFIRVDDKNLESYYNI